MARRYVRVTIKMIAEVPDNDSDIPRFIEESQGGIAYNLNESPMEGGEVDVKIEVFGPVEVMSNGFAKPWVEPS